MPESIRNLVERAGGERRLLLIAVGVAAVVGLWALGRWAAEPAWVPLFPGMPLESVAQVTPKLDEASIQYQLAAGGGQVQVRENDLARARVLLARDGFPAKGRPGFELFDQPSWGMTDFTQRINYRRALEGELERTISQMRGIASAQVHLALQEATPFKSEQRPEQASVVVKLNSGDRPAADVVEGIASLVASSVDGLTTDGVTVLDDAGHLLSQSGMPGSADGMTKRELALRRDVEGYLEQKTEELVAQVVGEGNVRVRIAANLSFDKVERTTQTVDPDQQVATQEQKTEITPGPNTPGAASTASTATYDVSRKVETVTGGVGKIERLTVAVLLNEQPKRPGATTATRLTPDDVSRVEALVRNAAGVDSARGDAISVVAIPFEPVVAAAPKPAEKPGILTRVQDWQKPGFMVLALLLAFVVALQVVRSLRPVVVQVPSSTGVAQLGPGDSAHVLHDQIAAVQNVAPRRQIASADQPEVAARVLRAWMKD